MSDFTDSLRGLKDRLGADGVTAAVNELNKLATKADAPWQANVVKMMADGVRKHGPAGLDLTVDQIENLLNGKSHDFSFTDLRTASNVVAKLQRAEAERQAKVRAFMTKATKILAMAFKAIVSSI